MRHNERMKTLTITEGRGRLGYWLKKAAQGEDIGFMFEGKVVALQPLHPTSRLDRVVGQADTRQAGSQALQQQFPSLSGLEEQRAVRGLLGRLAPIRSGGPTSSWRKAEAAER